MTFMTFPFATGKAENGQRKGQGKRNGLFFFISFCWIVLDNKFFLSFRFFLFFFLDSGIEGFVMRL